MNFLSIIEAKRDGHPLDLGQIPLWIPALVRGEIPDCQLAAFLMAVYFRGLSAAETAALTLAMRDSGETLRLPPQGPPRLDKHSTGGVGDKVSLPLAPLLACLGFRVPMISGRGLGITGGTLDKLESIPGFSTRLTPDQIHQQIARIGVVICGQTAAMVPADRVLYALRDITGTVPSVPLITASILSKKLAEGLDALVLDVKFGRAAFMRTRDEARELARAMTGLARDCGLPARALLTPMDVPLGRSAGNWLEVLESIDCLEGRGPADLRRLVLECAAQALALSRRAPDLARARDQAAECLDSGAPRRKWDQLLQAQGADLAALDLKRRAGPAAPALLEVPAPSGGFVTDCDARIVGEVLRDLGAGRLVPGAAVDPDAGVDRLAQPGDALKAGECLCRVHARSIPEAQAAAARLAGAFILGSHAPPHEAWAPELVEAG